MIPQQMKLEMTANNIANANTVGFKREGLFERSLLQARQNLLNVQGSVEEEDLPMGRYFDFTQGAFQKTDSPFDVAIDGQGFFLLQDNDGNEYLSRAGHFTLSSDGRLVTPDGRFVMGSEGPLVVRDINMDNSVAENDARPLEMRIQESGEVFVNENEIGKLTLVTVDSPQMLEKVSATDFKLKKNTPYSFVDSEAVRVKQGHLENSNVNIITEMVNMIQLQRSFEMGQKVISTNDSSLDRSFEVGRFT
jgi:flagellar basal-body rod protein FlgF